MYQDTSEEISKQYIDATQIRSAALDARHQAQKYLGSMYWRKTGAAGTEYLIKETRGIEKSLGRRSRETEAIIAEFKQRKIATGERAKSLAEAMKRQERINAALRVGRAPNVLVAVLNALADAGIVEHFLVIGTNALYAYETHAGVRFTGDITATTDVDLLWDSRKHLALVSRDPDFNTQGLIGVLRKADRSFAILAEESYRAANAGGYLVDLIKRRPVSCFDDTEKAQLKNIESDFWAAKIVNMDWLLSAPKFRQTIVGINGQMADMTTVDPRAFVLFKAYLARKEDRDPIKKPRDIAQARAVHQLIGERLPHLGFDRIHVFPERIRNMLDTLSPGGAGNFGTAQK